MRGTLFALLLAFAGTAEAASFSLVPTSSLFIGQGEMASFDVFYTAEPGDEPALAANLRITYNHDRGLTRTVLVTGNSNENPFEIPTLNLRSGCRWCFLPQNIVDVGGSQQTDSTVDASGGIKLGEVAFGVDGPFMGNAGVITLTKTPNQTGSRDANFMSIADNTPEVLAVIYVPEASLILLLSLSLFGLVWRARP